MQKLTYINLRGDVVEFTGAPPYILEHISGTGKPPGKIINSRGVWQQGSTPRRVTLDDRVVDLRFHIEGQSRADMYLRRQSLLDALATAHTFDGTRQGKLYYENDAVRRWCYAIPEDFDPDKRFNDFLVSAPIAFRCSDPYWHDDTINTVDMRMTGTGFSLPFSFPIQFGTSTFSATAVNTGQVEAPVQIDIYGSGETPSIVNHTTGAVITVARTIAYGEVLHIDTDPNALSVTLVDTDGSQTPAHGYLTVDSSLAGFYLAIGSNALEYQPSAPSASSRVTVSWGTRWEGV